MEPIEINVSEEVSENRLDLLWRVDVFMFELNTFRKLEMENRGI